MDVQFFIICGLLSLLLFIVALITHSIKRKKLVFPRSKFTLGNYYLLVLPIPLSVLIYSFLSNSWLPIIFFAIFCVAGILGEVLFSLWWSFFYKKSFWTYTTKTFFKKYTSSLNFLAWGLGGFTYLLILSYFPKINFSKLSFLFLFLFLVVAFIQILLFLLLFRRRLFKHKFQKVNFYNWLFFSLPIIIPLFLIVYWFGLTFLWLFLLMALAGMIIEYVFGKICHFFLSRRLWTYNHLSVDKDHFTILSFLPFALGGIYFWCVFLIVYLLF